MNARLVLLIALSFVTAAAIPGPCAYDPHPELDCADDGICPDDLVCSFDGFCKPIENVPGACPEGGCPDGLQCDGSGGCFGQQGCGACPAGFSCDGFQCIADGCPDGCPAGFSCDGISACVPDQIQPCIHFAAADDCGADEVCAPLTLALNSSSGTCVPRPATTIALGDPCVPTIGENACAGGFCAPTGHDRGVCLAGCTPGGGCANPDERCAEPFDNIGGFAALCLPACSEVADCPSGMDSCFVPRLEPSCLPENRRCGIVGCDFEGCGGACASAADCGADAVCAPYASTSACSESSLLNVCQRAIAELNEVCDLVEGVACSAGLACIPTLAPDGRGRCVDQASVPEPDLAPCTDIDNANVCNAGSFCALTGFATGETAVCLRMCDGDDDCDGDLCRPAIDYGSEVAAFSVCVPPCDLVTACPETLRCNIVTSIGCSGDGHCAAAPNQGVTSESCVTNEECDVGGVCSADLCRAVDEVCP